MAPKIKVISLKSAESRRNKFIQRNKHIQYEFVDGIIGKELPEDVYYDKSLIDWNGLEYSPGAIGNALSHLRLWNEVIETNTPLTIMEDDAVIHLDFVEKHKKLMETLPEDWDIVFWGYNQDSVLGLQYGISHAYIIHQDDFPDDNRILKYQEQDIQSNLYKLLFCWGLCGYTISPKGAKLYKENCFPLRNFVKMFAYKRIGNRGLDTAMSDVHTHSKSYFCFPTIVYNQNNETDVWTHLAQN